MAERGEADKCIKILKKIARTNKKEVKQEVYDRFEVCSFGFLLLLFWSEAADDHLIQKLVQEQYEAAKGLPVPKLTDAFKTPRLRRVMLITTFA